MYQSPGNHEFDDGVDGLPYTTSFGDSSAIGEQFRASEAESMQTMDLARSSLDSKMYKK